MPHIFVKIFRQIPDGSSHSDRTATYIYIYIYQSEGFTPNGDISFLGALGIGVGSGIGGSSSVVVAVRCQKVHFLKMNFPRRAPADSTLTCKANLY